ncbi:MAG: hypothetical protein RLZZ352_1891 [Pseudomonadota bacterium]|jgi:hypothetical protein
MRAYQFEQHIPATHAVVLPLPSDVAGNAKIIVLFPDAGETAQTLYPPFDNLAEYTAWLETQPPTGRTKEEIDQYVREERDSWDD